jgi:CelD/BcsL family acetyltransferase involved in cellulose biosynthesis
VLEQPDPPVRIETISAERDLAGLAAGWDELVRAMPRPSPFLLHGWLSEWWRHYGRGGALAVHVAYRGDRLIGALPLCLRPQFGLSVAQFVGGKLAALADLMVLPGEESAAGALADRASASDHDLADFFGIPGESRLVAALPSGAVRLVERLEAPVLDLSAGWEAVCRAKLSAKARGDRRRRRRQLDALGNVDVKVARTPAELGEALDEAFRVYALRWRGRREPSGFVAPLGQQFYREALLRLAEQGVPRLVSVRLEDRTIAFALYLQLCRRVYGVTMAFDPAYARFSPGSEALFTALETAASEGAERVEFLGATAEHKRRFTDRFEPIYEAFGLARTVRGRAAVEALDAGIRFRRRIKRSDTAQRLYYRIPRRRFPEVRQKT